MSTPKFKTKIPTQDLKCQNKCGFYGNPEWQGYCSKCHKELNQKMKSDRSTKSSKKVQRSHSDVQESAHLGFGKFEEKKKQQTEKRSKTIKSIMKRGHTLKGSTNHTSARDVFLIGEIQKLVKDLNLKEIVGKDVVKEVQFQLDAMSKLYDKSIDEQSEAMHDFYNMMYHRCEMPSFYPDMSSETTNILMDGIEKQLMSHLHSATFQQISSECEEKDLALQSRIRSLKWMTSQHLFLNIDESSPDVRDLVDRAITDAIAVGSEIAPQEKIGRIVSCSKSIFEIINLCQGVTASADEFLPSMVYIILKANPPLLQSNIKYITSFSIPARLRSGEGAYYFTNLCCAVAFVEDLTSEHLNITESEFQRYMSGEMPTNHVRQNPTDCEGVRLMNQNLATLTEMQEKNTHVLSEIIAFREEVERFQETLRKCISTPPITLSPTPYTVPSNTDTSLIPEVLRNRIVFAPVEDILVDISSRCEKEVEMLPVANFNPPVDLSTIKSSKSSTDSNILASLQSLRVDLPSAKKRNEERLPIHGCQQMLSIQDLEYPTELFPDKAEEGEVEFGPFERCDGVPDSLAHPVGALAHPLSPESAFIGENINLPPPLVPLVVKNPNSEMGDKG